MVSTKTQPLIFGHRGASLHAPENTLAAFILARKLGADGIELDAKLTRDSKVVVIHDATVDRTCDGAGTVRYMSFDELRGMDAGAKFDPRYKGEKIPSLDEVFEALGKKLLINVELTNYADPKDDLPEKVAELVKKHNLGQAIIFSSFHPTTLWRIQSLLPETPAGLLAFPGFPGALSRSLVGRHWSRNLIHPYYSDVKERFVKRQNRWGRKINVWTVDDKNELERLINLHVNGIITDDVPLAVQVRKTLMQ